MIAYHGIDAIKASVIAELSDHRAADSLVQGYGYWKDGQGCAVGCTIKSNDHEEYEARFGIPVALARLKNSVFENLPAEQARQWPERFMNAAVVGSDLRRVHLHFLHWLLTTPDVNPGIEHPVVRDAVKQCAEVIADLAVGKAVAESTAMSAESAARAAWSAAWSADSSAWSAECAAWSAESAASAMCSASAGSAAKSARCAARSAASDALIAGGAAKRAAWIKISDRLIDLLQAAPIPKTVS